jgi:glycosyltransferase involved in cell wall biosynthesis
MRIAIASVQVPFISGGAEILARGLEAALQEHGHHAERVTMPFRFGPPAEVLRAMDQWSAENFERFDCGEVDRVICLKFPSYYLHHPNKVTWLLHQHRGVYELFNTPFGASSENPAETRLREEIFRRDAIELGKCGSVFTIARRVSERLKLFNGVASRPLYHPPRSDKLFYCGQQLPYIFFPSRLETLKRQELLIRAMAQVRSSVCAIIAGAGGQQTHLGNLIESLALQHRVRLIGPVTTAEMLAWYANSLAVFFGPFDEDYGYITLEAMLSAKPVITCTDSGGPLEFVVDGETGIVAEPKPEAVAEAIDRLCAAPALTAERGRAGLDRYRMLDISWDKVVCELTS